MEENISAECVDAIRRLVAQKRFSCLLLKTFDKTILLLHSENKMSFNSGLHTLQNLIRCENIEKGPVHKPFPGMNLRLLTFTEADILYRNGDMFDMANIRMTIAAAKDKISLLMDTSVPLKQLVKHGDIDITDVAAIASARRHLHEEDLTLQFEDKPDLLGDLVLHFQEYSQGGHPIPDSIKTDVTIVGRPDDIVTKKKHYWIYSCTANYGKSTTIKKELVNVYKAIVVSHASNAMEVPSNAQFLIFDEFGSKKCIHIDDLKRMTGGDASDGCLNRKSYGKSYVPRSCAQIIILGNKSPYEVYSSYDRNLKRNVMSGDDLSTLSARFEIIRLDGGDLAEKVKYIETSLLAPEEYNEQMRDLIYKRSDNLIESDTLRAYDIRTSLEMCYDLYVSRDVTVNHNIPTFEKHLQDICFPVDWPVITQVLHLFGQHSYFSNLGDNFRCDLSGHLPADRALMVRARTRQRRD